MTSIGIKDLKRFLATQTQSTLENELITLFQKIPAVKKYFSLKLSTSGNTALVKDAQEKINRGT